MVTHHSFQEMVDDLRSRRTRRQRILGATWYPVRRRAINGKYAVKWAYQRVVRGWDDRAAWGCGDQLARTLGEQLVEMADIAHGFPTDYGPVHSLPDNPEDNPHFATWVNDLRTHGEALLAYHRGDQLELTEAEWDVLSGRAQDALRWVADNLEKLWD